MWFEIQIGRDGPNVRVEARGSGDRKASERLLGGGFDAEAVIQFGRSVAKSATYGRALPTSLRDTAIALRNALFDGDIGDLYTRLAEAAHGPVLVRFDISDPELKIVPWEALCNPAPALDFWGTSPDFLPVRRTNSENAWQPQEIRETLRVLAIAPTDTASLPNLRAALASRIVSGEIEWLEPIVGEAAKAKHLFERLARAPTPHVLHFLGHGRLTKGVPELRVGDDGEEHVWRPITDFAQEIKANFRGALRLVILEACEGAAQDAFASAAESLVDAGADAVVAYLWPIRADVARTCSEALYKSVVGSGPAAGDIAAALNAARRTISRLHDDSAETFSPVLYLRGPSATLFKFNGQKRKYAWLLLAAVSTVLLGVALILAFKSSKKTPPPPNVLAFVVPSEPLFSFAVFMIDEDGQIVPAKGAKVTLRLENGSKPIMLTVSRNGTVTSEFHAWTAQNVEVSLLGSEPFKGHIVHRAKVLLRPHCLLDEGKDEVVFLPKSKSVQWSVWIEWRGDRKWFSENQASDKALRWSPDLGQTGCMILNATADDDDDHEQSLTVDVRQADRSRCTMALPTTGEIQMHSICSTSKYETACRDYICNAPRSN